MSAWALRLYPPSFRARYGAEVQALVQDLGGGHTADLLRGAARAWLRPAFGGPDAVRRRRQATAATVWVAWCAGMLVAPAMSRDLLDPPVRHAPRDLLDVTQVLFVAGWAAALLGALPLVVAAVLPAIARRDGRSLRPLLPAIGLAAVVAAGLGAVLLVRRGHPGSWPHPSVLFAAVVLAWLVSFLAFVVALGLGPAAALVRLEPRTSALRWPMLGSVAVTLVLAALAALCGAAMARAGYLDPVGGIAVAVACGAAAVAVVSTTRGVLAR